MNDPPKLIKIDKEQALRSIRRQLAVRHKSAAGAIQAMNDEVRRAILVACR